MFCPNKQRSFEPFVCLALVLERQQSFLFPIPFSALERVPESGRGLIKPVCLGESARLCFLSCPRTLSAGARAPQNGHQDSVLESQTDFDSTHAPYLLLPLLQERGSRLWPR